MIALCRLAGGLADAFVVRARRFAGLRSGLQRNRSKKASRLRKAATDAQAAYNNRFVAPKRDYYVQGHGSHAKERPGVWKHDTPDQMLRDSFARPSLTMTAVAKQRPKPASSRHVTNTKFCVCYNLRAMLHDNVSSSFLAAYGNNRPFLAHSTGVPKRYASTCSGQLQVPPHFPIV